MTVLKHQQIRASPPTFLHSRFIPSITWNSSPKPTQCLLCSELAVLWETSLSSQPCHYLLSPEDSEWHNYTHSPVSVNLSDPQSPSPFLICSKNGAMLLDSGPANTTAAYSSPEMESPPGRQASSVALVVSALPCIYVYEHRCPALL